MCVGDGEKACFFLKTELGSSKDEAQLLFELFGKTKVFGTGVLNVEYRINSEDSGLITPDHLTEKR